MSKNRREKSTVECYLLQLLPFLYEMLTVGDQSLLVAFDPLPLLLQLQLQGGCGPAALCQRIPVTSLHLAFYRGHVFVVLRFNPLDLRLRLPSPDPTFEEIGS